MAKLNCRLLIPLLCLISIATWIGFKDRLHSTSVPFIRHHLLHFYGSLSRFSPASPMCIPQSNVMFLKTHKTAGTAVFNVLLRYSEKHNLTVGLPKEYNFHYGEKFKEEFVLTKDRPINIICHHMVFNYTEVQKVMPKNTSYITILRDPSSQFHSAFHYYRYTTPSFSKIRKQQPNPFEYWLNHTDQLFKPKKLFWWLEKNGVFFDLGYDNLSKDKKYIEQAIQELDKIFGLVLISDYFAESMLLLKEYLCWTMEDVLFIIKNARDSPQEVLMDRVKQQIHEWNNADSAMYQYFNRTFWKKIEAYGHERMKKDVKTLKNMNEQIREYCIDGEPVSNNLIRDALNKMYNPRGVVVKGYNLKENAKQNTTCINLAKAVLQWTDEMKSRLKKKV